MNPASGFQVQCLKCEFKFKSKKTSTIKRHYEAKHRNAFVNQRKRSGNDAKEDKEDVEDGATPAKRWRQPVLYSNFSDALEYTNALVRIQSRRSLPFSMWDDVDIQRIIEPYNTFFNVKINGKFHNKY